MNGELLVVVAVVAAATLYLVTSALRAVRAPSCGSGPGGCSRCPRA